MSSDISAILYSAINEIGREKIQMDLASNIALSTKHIEDILKRCLETSGLEMSEENLVALCKGLLHFMLTTSLLPSERSVSFHGADLDVVVPSLKVLTKNPENALIIQLTRNDAESDRITSAESVQPHTENVWIVSPKRIATGLRNYHLGEGPIQYSRIVEDISEFVGRKKVGRLKLLPGK
ncbi:MAG TPA: hypothetical protein VIB07_03110 [Nitrososphaera sp.]